MPDGTVSYSANAIKAAAAGVQSHASGCSACEKVGLPVLLVRPGLADKGYPSAESAGLGNVFNGITEPSLSYFSYVARTLRQGYVYAYYEKAHTSMLKANKGWQVFHVDEGGYLTPQFTNVKSADQPFTCSRAAGYAGGMMFSIPDAKNTKRVWVAYSDHPWSEKVCEQYAGDEALRNKRMTCINAPSAKCDRSLPLKEDKIQSILDYTTTPFPYLEQTPSAALAGNPHPRLNIKGSDPEQNNAAFIDPLSAIEPVSPSSLTRGEDAADLMGAAQSMINATKGAFQMSDALMVGVSDPVGVTFEAAYMRVTLCNKANQWVGIYPDGHWRLQSALSIEAILGKKAAGNDKQLGLIDQQAKEKWESCKASLQYDSARMWHSIFKAMQADGRLSPYAIFSYETKRLPGIRGLQGETIADTSVKGHVYIPSEQRLNAKAAERKEGITENLTKDAWGNTYAKFLSTYRDKSKKDVERLAKIEQDYFAWLDSDARKRITQHDFDITTPEDGAYYCLCVSKLTYAGHLTDKGLEYYKSFLLEDTSDKNNLFVRALLGNNEDSFKAFSQGTATSLISLLAAKLSDTDAATRAAIQGHSVNAWDRIANHTGVAVSDFKASVHTILTNATAVSAARYEKLSEDFLKKLKTLVGRVGSDSVQDSRFALLKVRVPVAEMPYWLNQINQAKREAFAKVSSKMVGGRNVRSMLAGADMMLQSAGMNKAASVLEGTVEIYVWVKKTAAELKEAAMGAGSAAAASVGSSAKTAGRLTSQYLVKPAAGTLNKAWQNTQEGIHIKASQLRGLLREQWDLIHAGTSILAGAAAALSLWALYETWKKYDTLAGEDRDLATLGLLSSGMGAVSGMLDLGALMLRATLANSVKLVSGVIAAGATLLMSIQSFWQASSAYGASDEDTFALYVTQGVLFGIAAVAIGYGAFAVSLMATGIGVLLVIAGGIVGLFVVLTKDKPLAAWAAKSIWGTADEEDKWGSLNRETSELNERLLGLQVEFDYRYLDVLEMASIQARLNPLTASTAIAADWLAGDDSPLLPTLTREAFFKLVLPKSLQQKVAWQVTIIAKRLSDNKNVIVAKASHGESAGLQQCSKWEDVSANIEHTPPEDHDDKTTYLSAQLDTNEYAKPYAEFILNIAGPSSGLVLQETLR